MEVDALIRPIGLALLLNVWFNTKAFVEYLDYFGLFIHSFLIYKFKNKQEEGSLLSYPAFLTSEFPDSFCLKILACPICLATWLNIIAFTIDLSFSNFVVSYYLTLVFYYFLQKLQNA